MARVLRMKVGEHVQLIAAERLYEGELTAVNDKVSTVRVLLELPSPECDTHIMLVQGLPKADKMEMIIQKATELGTWEILPVEMERSVAKIEGKAEQKRERWNRIAQEAAKQSGRAHVPEVLMPCKLSSAVAKISMGEFDVILIAWEEEGNLRLSEAMKKLLKLTPKLRAVAVVIGPEGGITPGEIAVLQSAGAQCVTLGRRILRTETAGLCAIAVIMSELGEL